MQVWLRSLSARKRMLYKVALWSVFVGGSVPLIAITHFGFHFLPARFGTLGLVIGFLPGVCFGAWVATITVRAFPKNMSTVQVLSTILFEPLLCGFLTFNCVSLTLPLLHATIVRTPTEVIVRVASTTPPTRACKGSLDISRYALLHLCDVPSDLKRSLTVGDTIVLTGTGSSLGIFYSEMAKAN
jgi:hypothetical protein